MSNDLRLLALFEEANPVPDEHAESIDVPPATYLAALQQRSSDVTKLDTKPVQEGKRPRRVLIGAAAAVVVILGGLVLLATNTDDEVPVATDPTIPAPEISDEEQAVRALIAAADVQALRAAVTENWVGTHSSPDQTFDEAWSGIFASVEVLGVEHRVLGCESAFENSIVCEISYSDAYTEAMGLSPIVDSRTFYVVDGRVDVGDPPDGPGAGFSLFARYANAVGMQDQFLDRCPGGPIRPTCAQFMIDNLEDWVAWTRSNE